MNINQPLRCVNAKLSCSFRYNIIHRHTLWQQKTVHRSDCDSMRNEYVGLTSNLTYKMLSKKMFWLKYHSRNDWWQNFRETRGQSNLAIAALNPLPLPLAVGDRDPSSYTLTYLLTMFLEVSKSLHSKQDLKPFSHFCRLHHMTDRCTTVQDHRSQ